jgi:signal transduction histidine kinase
MLRRFLGEMYGSRAWARLLYALVQGPLGAFGFVFLFAVVFSSVTLAITFVGLPLLAVGLHGARVLGALHRWLARTLPAVAVDSPLPFSPRPGFLGWFRSTLSDATGWRAALYLLAQFPLSMVAFLFSVALWLTGAWLISYPAWWGSAAFTTTDVRGQVHHALVIGDYVFDTWPRALMIVAAGVIVLVVVPWVTRALLVPNIALARALLGPSRASQLRRRRAVAVDDAAARLRRIERDLHDGTQAQLVTLAMQLDMAKEELAGGDATAAVALLDTAHQGAKQALVELRDLARGLHPPVLDSGLAPALESLAARSAVPVALHIDLPERPSPAIETIVYFSAAELMTNLVKHSHARHATVTLAHRRPGWLRLTVSDDGVGGAHPGGGLGGLADRVGMVDGQLALSSPDGGPTVATIDLPVHA